MRVLILFLLSIACISSSYAAEVNVSVASASARPGDHFALIVSGSLNADTLNTLQIVFNYNASRLKIDSVLGGTDAAMKCLSPTFIDSTFATLGIVKISCSELQNISDGKICTLYVTALAGEGSEALITPASVRINDSSQSGNFTAGKITFDDTPVTQKFIEGIGQPFPNPFWGYIRIPYIIDKPTNVSFYIYDLAGRLTQEFPSLPRSRGSYFFNFAPDEGTFSNGAYYVVMKTDSKVYNSYFIRLR